MRFHSLAFILILISACAIFKKKPEVSEPGLPDFLPPKVQAPAEPAAKFKTLLPDDKWSEHLLAAVKASKLAALRASDDGYFCGAKGMSPENYAHLLAGMVKFESGFAPKKEFREPFTSNGKPVISTGLLQISISSGNRYGCGFKTQSDLHDPLKNLSCGVKILETLAVRDNTIAAGKTANNAKGGAKYWSVLREKYLWTNPANGKKIWLGKKEEIKALVAPWCQ